MQNTDTQTACVLRLFGARAEAVRHAADLPEVDARCAARGGETLLALRAATPEALARAKTALHRRFAAALYGEGAEGLAHAAVQALETHERLLACADEAAAALLTPRLEPVEGAARVFDFGALSCASPEVAPRLAEAARGAGNAAQQALARVQAAARLVGAELAAGCLPQDEAVLLLVGTRSGCWLRCVCAAEAPGLWLLDMVRRAACGAKQAPGTRWLRWRAARRVLAADLPPAVVFAPPEEAAPSAVPSPAPAAAPPPAPAKRRRRRALPALLLLAGLAAFAAAWQFTGGNLAALPEALGLARLPHSGALLL